MLTTFWLESLTDRDHQEDQNVDGRVTVQQIKNCGLLQGWRQQGPPKCQYSTSLQHHNSEDHNLNLHRYENLKSHNKTYLRRMTELKT